MLCYHYHHHHQPLHFIFLTISRCVDLPSLARPFDCQVSSTVQTVVNTPYRTYSRFPRFLQSLARLVDLDLDLALDLGPTSRRPTVLTSTEIAFGPLTRPQTTLKTNTTLK